MRPSFWTALAALSLLWTTQLQAEQTFTLSDQTTTVRNRDEALQWTPESVTVIKASDIEQTYRRDLEDIEGITPGLIIDRLSGTTQGAAISIRGIGSNETAKGFEPAVAVSVDGVYVGTHTNQLQVLFDFEQIEIARGPQSTYQGAPNIAGTINLVRTKPTGEFGTKLRASLGDYKRQEFDAVVNFPITSSIAGKVSVSYLDGDGNYFKNITNNRPENEEDRIAFSASLLWDVSDNFSVQYTYDNESNDSQTPGLLNISTLTDLVCITGGTNGTCGSSAGPSIPQTGSINKTAQNFSNKRTYEGDYHTLRMDFDWQGYDFTSITGYRTSDEKMNRDLDATQIDFYSIASSQDYEQFSQDLRVSKQYTEQIHIAAGIYILNTEYSIFQEEFFILNALANAGLANGHTAGETQLLTSKTQSNTASGFLHVEYVLNDQWTADFGTRYSFIEKDFDHSPSAIAFRDIIIPSPVLIIADREWGEWNYSAGISYKVDDQAMIYARFSQGSRPGGFDENAVSLESAQVYGAESSENWEIGMKSEWFDDRLRINMAYYQIEQDNKREQFISPVGPGRLESITANVARVESNGFELEVEYVPLDNLFLRGSYNFIDADYRKYEIADLANPGATVDISDTATSNWAPTDLWYLSGIYSINLGPGVVNFSAEYKYSTDYQTNPLIPVSKVNNNTSWNLAVDYRWQDWTFRVFSQNFNDKRYLQNVVNLNDGDVVPLNPAATGGTGLVTYSEYNQPTYAGFEVIFQPDLSKYLK